MDARFLSCINSAISPYVRNIWQLEGCPPYSSETILPKGEIELIFSFAQSPSFSRLAGADEGLTPRCFVNGLSDTPIMLKAPRHQRFFGVVLSPIAVKPLLTAPAGEFLNRVIDLTLIDHAFKGLWQQLAEAGDFERRVAIIGRWASKKMSRLNDRELALSGFLSSPAPVASVTEMSGRFCYSGRQLNRKAHELFGMSAESLARYQRYLRSLMMIHNSMATLTGIGHSSGYFDQAHFIREFREHAGITPGEYRAQKSHMPGHIFR